MVNLNEIKDIRLVIHFLDQAAWRLRGDGSQEAWLEYVRLSERLRDLLFEGEGGSRNGG
jgi:hypothetical protein